eukprot:3648495-Amphidinium_carterae.1
MPPYSGTLPTASNIAAHADVRVCIKEKGTKQVCWYKKPFTSPVFRTLQSFPPSCAMSAAGTMTTVLLVGRGCLGTAIKESSLALHTHTHMDNLAHSGCLSLCIGVARARVSGKERLEARAHTKVREASRSSQ